MVDRERSFIVNLRYAGRHSGEPEEYSPLAETRNFLQLVDLTERACYALFESGRLFQTLEDGELVAHLSAKYGDDSAEVASFFIRKWRSDPDNFGKSAGLYDRVTQDLRRCIDSDGKE